MPQIIQAGTLNTTALVVPDLYVQVVPPQTLLLNGVPTSVTGVVGTATWGGVNQPVIIATMADYARRFGQLQARKYDMGTQVATAVQQGAQAFRCVRVTDGTDTAAAAQFISNGVSLVGFNARYTGTAGNQISVSIQTGSAAGSYALIVSHPSLGQEKFDNIAGPGASPSSAAWQAFWTRVVAAANAGTSTARGPSQLVIAVTGNAATWVGPTLNTPITLATGTDGATAITAATLIGLDGVQRTGMYALRGLGCSIAMLADADDSTQWTTQAAFGLSEGIYMICTGPAGDTITNAVSVKTAAGLDTYAVKLMFGDWLFWNDQTNNMQRLVSPQGFVAGRLANLSPEQSSLNKQLFSVVASQRSTSPSYGGSYSAYELQVLFQAGIDVVSNPQPGGAYWGVRCGHNSSSNSGTNGDNYTRLTNYIAATLAAGMGLYVGQPITTKLFGRVRATQLSFFENMRQQGLLSLTSAGGLPYSVVCDASNNPDSRTGLGYLQSDAQVKYSPIAEKFICNLEGGQTVAIVTSQASINYQVAA